MDFKVTNVTVNLDTTLSASDFVVVLNTYKMVLNNVSFFAQSAIDKPFYDTMYVMVTYKNHSIK